MVKIRGKRSKAAKASGSQTASSQPAEPASAAARALGVREILDRILSFGYLQLPAKPTKQELRDKFSIDWHAWDAVNLHARAVNRLFREVFDDKLWRSLAADGNLRHGDFWRPVWRIITRSKVLEKAASILFLDIEEVHKDYHWASTRGKVYFACAGRLTKLFLSEGALKEIASHWDDDRSIQLPHLKHVGIDTFVPKAKDRNFLASLADLTHVDLIFYAKSSRKGSLSAIVYKGQLALATAIKPETVTRVAIDVRPGMCGPQMCEALSPKSMQPCTVLEHFKNAKTVKVSATIPIDFTVPASIETLQIGGARDHVPEDFADLLADPTRVPKLKHVGPLPVKTWLALSDRWGHWNGRMYWLSPSQVDKAVAGMKARGTIDNVEIVASELRMLMRKPA